MNLKNLSIMEQRRDYITAASGAMICIMIFVSHCMLFSKYTPNILVLLRRVMTFSCHGFSISQAFFVNLPEGRHGII